MWIWFVLRELFCLADEIKITGKTVKFWFISNFPSTERICGAYELRSIVGITEFH